MTVVFSPGLPQGLSYSGLTPLMHGQQDMASTYAPGGYHRHLHATTA